LFYGISILILLGLYGESLNLINFVEIQLANEFFMPFPIKQDLLKKMNDTWKRKITAILIGLLFSISLSEIILRNIFTIKPGFYWDSSWFHSVDTLKVLNGYYADEFGIFKIEKSIKQRIDAQIKLRTDNKDFVSPIAINSNDEIGLANLTQQALSIISGNSKSDLAKLYQSTLRKKEWSSFDSLFVDYINHPINEDGFRSVSFRSISSTRKKVMLIGDSFTFGQSALDLSNSFSDQLLADGFLVYNFGIPGADPAQYLAIAQRYLPILKPDFLIINVYAGNDIIYYQRKPEPMVPLFYFTNAGCIINHPFHKYLYSPKKALDFALISTLIPQRTSWDKFCSLSSTGTLLWKVMAKIGWVNISPIQFEDYYQEAQKFKLEFPSLNDELKEIKKLAYQTNSRCLISFIPEVKRISGLSSPTDYQGLNWEKDYLVNHDLKPDDYNIPLQHFNDQGHYNYAKFLEIELIRP
jgi:hypothetical protein